MMQYTAVGAGQAQGIAPTIVGFVEVCRASARHCPYSGCVL